MTLYFKNNDNKNQWQIKKIKQTHIFHIMIKKVDFAIFLMSEIKAMRKAQKDFKNEYDLDIYDPRQFQIFCFFMKYFHRCILYKSMYTKSKAE